MQLADLITWKVSSMIPDRDITGLTSDSRQCRRGYLFAAYPGEKSDGRDYIDAAIANGATVILTTPDIVRDDDMVIVHHKDPRYALGLMARRFYGYQPESIIAVTGTNGKTSVVHFCRQLWQHMGLKSASIGTLGVVDDQCKDGIGEVGLTTPDTLTLHKTLKRLKQQGVEHVAMEASSHGLEQQRLAGVQVRVAAMTNISHDHLDYHKTQKAYVDAKMRLFTEVMEEGVAVVNADIREAEMIAATSKKKGHTVMTYGRKGKDVKLKAVHHTLDGQDVVVEMGGQAYELSLNLIGMFQIENLLCAMTMVLASGCKAEQVVKAAESVTAVPGRMQQVATHPCGAPILVDYAHTPDALEKILRSLQAHVTNRLLLVVGCGGDRDKEKRAAMGNIAAQYADRVVVTDDNPRTEDPAAIRKEILRGCPDGIEIADRKEAIEYVVNRLEEGDILVIAGKGHEDYQIIGEEKQHFDDAEVVRAVV